MNERQAWKQVVLGITPLERESQAELFAWKRQAQHLIPQLRFMFSVPNGMHAASAKHASMMIAQGMTRGVLDVWFPHARGAHPGLAFEMKAKDGKPTHEQEEWLAWLAEEGWATGVCHSMPEAKSLVMSYLALPCRRTGSLIRPSLLQAALLLTTRKPYTSRAAVVRARVG